MQRQRPLWMLVPGGVLAALLIVVPLAVAVQISLLDLDQYSFRQWLGAPFVGVRNYHEALTRSPLAHSILVSTGYAATVTVVTLPLGVAAALATHNRFAGRAVVRSAFLIPFVLPSFVVGTLWRIILQPAGVANRVLDPLGVPTGLWLNGPRSFWALVIVQAWAAWPLVYLLTLAGLQTLDRDLHEAAALDGAGWWAKLRYVIFPCLRGPVSLAMLISFLHDINNFALPFVLFGVPSPHDVEVLPVLTYIESFQNFRFGLSAAMAVLSVALIAVPIAVYLRAVKLDVGEEARTT
ncbi:carbohydrate ABC transporter permease [Planosporangium mesophilum]|uniref:ABC transporter permease n=1 Tax=Planosporangium mesophilum TaxID=689768 RepID=A0A8J3TDC8_9ACTN|nr:sugar ABC transporter permease [Planosporangium mesophilum]NJC82739.1 sugar ABC transporter permease [Planosporangium mesophilum]GII23792.1 ABC transporter permease [Planosporangium mesophilum]